MNGLLKKAITFKQVLLSMSAGGLLLVSMQAMPQLCDTSSLASTPTHSFLITAEGTAFDRKTNLEWKVCAEGQTWSSGDCMGSASVHNWQQALDVPKVLNASEGYAEKSDWRLPNIKELATIIEHRCELPAINHSVFFKVMHEDDYANENTDNDREYWSASPTGSLNEASSWLVDFTMGDIESHARTFVRKVRLVRTVPKPD
ncbi:hypothetical protein MNBD_GAMMA04-1514 [hydrothermal vent metagenome]|uniref:Lcl C-terminal domain-containing protein n=1 Tax=hydrothermal vent metagenome TaxID=652676 RepID=A0A3B0X1J8_9ZZZZ